MPMIIKGWIETKENLNCYHYLTSNCYI